MSAHTTETEILSAHARHDRRRVAALYLDGARDHLARGEDAAAAFFFTQAYVFALDAGDEEAATAAHAHLVALGRET